MYYKFIIFAYEIGKFTSQLDNVSIFFLSVFIYVHL